MIKLFALIFFVIVMEESHHLSAILVAVAITLISTLLTHMLCKDERHDEIGLKINRKFFIYLMHLAKEIFFSTVSVCKAICFRKKSNICPVTAKIITKQKTDEAKVLFGNSITLTPGTITVDIDDNTVMLHAIEADCIDGAKNLDKEIVKSQL